MRRYHSWLLALGLMAMTPAAGMAGLFGEKSSKPAKAPATGKNQQVAEQIGAALGAQKFKGFKADVRFERGVAMVSGMTASPRQKAAVTQVVAGVPGVKRVDNRLRVAAPRRPAAQAPRRQAARRPAAPPMRRGAIRQAAGQQGPGQGRVTRVPTSVPRSAIRQVQGQAPAGGPIPSYGAMASPASHAVYDMPNLPSHAWPAYASHPNYSQVSYPKEYSAAAWPYIGPFYPYPQVPLGWRKAQLEWDDGSWKLNFAPRTEKWWWFLDYKKW
jgi:hypothetical protein